MEPQWLILARKELGVHEVGNNGGKDVARYIAESHCGAIGDPWCAIFANAMLEQSGVHGTRSPSSQSFRHSQLFVPIPKPALGAIAVFWRISPNSGLGHVGFYVEENSQGLLNILGGNESDMVKLEWLNPHGRSFGLVGYWWPKAVALPHVGGIVASSGPVPIAGTPKVT